MLRKNIRLRREYLFNKSNAKKVQEKYEQKMKVKMAQLKKSELPTELAKEKDKLEKELQFDDNNTIVPRTHIDDEYSLAYLKTPKILLTNSRNPSSRLSQFAKEMGQLIPNTVKINRGNNKIGELVEMCQKNDCTDLVILHEHRGEPDGMIISHQPVGPTIYFGIKNAVLRHDLKEKPDNMSEALPHLIFSGFNSALGERVTNILKHLFPSPKYDSKRVLTFSNQNDIISFRHHTYEKTDYKTVQLNEIGPRFELKLFQISLGTINQKEAAKEWVLRPYMNTAYKRKAL